LKNSEVDYKTHTVIKLKKNFTLPGFKPQKCITAIQCLNRRDTTLVGDRPANSRNESLALREFTYLFLKLRSAVCIDTAHSKMGVASSLSAGYLTA